MNPVFRKTLRLARPYWPLLAVSLVLSLVASWLSGAVAWLVKPVLDRVFLERSYQYLRLLPVGLLGLYVLRGVTTFLQSYLMRLAAVKLVNDLRLKLYGRILHLPLSTVVRETPGRLVSRVMNDTMAVEPILARVFQTLMLEGFTVLTLVAVAVSRRWDLALLALTVFPGVALGARKLGQKARRTRHRAQQEVANLTHRLTESLEGLREIKVYRQEGRFLSLFRRELGAYQRFIMKVTKYREGSKLLVDLLTGVGGGLVLTYGGYLIVHGVITTGDFFSILTAILMIFTPVRKISKAYTGVQDAAAALERLEAVLSQEEERGGPRRASPPREGIRFEGVSFRYPGTEDLVLRDVDLFLPAGRVVALVGPSGAGKTTLVSLVVRFFDPSQGRILVDGVDLRELDLASWRELIGLVSQEVVLFQATIAENIAFGRPGASREEIVRAARLAHAHEFIEKLPRGYDTVLGEEGLNLSGGQRQRLAIARAILRDPPILILDEATSHLDSLSEKMVQEALENLMRGRTTIVVAHRLSTVRHADLLVVMDHGRVVDQGRHEEVLRRCALYRDLYQTFARGERKVIPLPRQRARRRSP